MVSFKARWSRSLNRKTYAQTIEHDPQRYLRFLADADHVETSSIVSCARVKTGSKKEHGQLIERTRQSKNCYCLAEAYIGGGTDGREPERTMRNFLFFLTSAHFDDGWYCAQRKCIYLR